MRYFTGHLVPIKSPKPALNTLLVGVLGFIIYALGSCTSDEVVILTNEASDISIINYTFESRTRGGYIDLNVRDKQKPFTTSASSIHAYTFLKSSLGRKAWFEAKTTISNSSNGNYKIQPIGDNIQLHWIDDRGLDHKLHPNTGETWQGCCIMGGGTLDPNTLRLSFDDERKGLKANQIKMANFSPWTDVRIKKEDAISLDIAFERLGIVFQVKIDADKSVIKDNNYAHDFKVFNNMISPYGYFDFSANADVYNNSSEPTWISTASKDGYTFSYNPKTQNVSDKEGQDLFVLWGMPMKRKDGAAGLLTITSSDKDLVVINMADYEGNTNGATQSVYTVGERQPYKDYSLPQKQKKTYLLSRVLTRLGGVANVNYPIPLARFSEYNVALDNRRFADDHIISNQGYFSQPRAKEIVPDGYHLPLVEEFTAAFPYSFDLSNSLVWEELEEAGTRTEIARMGNGRNVEGKDNDYIQQKFFATYHYDKTSNILYAIRFVGLDFSTDPLNNVFRCAYRYEFLDIKNPEHARVKITVRYLGTRQLIDRALLMSSEYWAMPNGTDVVRYFPLGGRYSIPGRAHNGQEGYVDRGDVGNYWTSSISKNGARTWPYYIPITYDKIDFVHSQEPGNQNMVRPVVNAKP